MSLWASILIGVGVVFTVSLGVSLAVAAILSNIGREVSNLSHFVDFEPSAIGSTEDDEEAVEQLVFGNTRGY